MLTPHGRIQVHAAKLLLALLLSWALGACKVEVKPKNLGADGRPDFSATDSDFQSSFTFNFAYRDSTLTAPYTVYLQGGANAKSAITGACNLSGTACVCEFQTAAGAVLESTDSSRISYEDTGNYLRCTYRNSSGGGHPAKVRIHTISNDVSATLTVETTLTLSKLLGTELDQNRVRTVYLYHCDFNFLQKQGTTSTGFDCTNQATTCSGGSNFCLLQARFPFYLYSDNYSTNFGQKLADRLYNGNGTDKICGIQIKQLDCAMAAGTPTKDFGIYVDQTGIWDKSVQLGAGPNIATVSYGFAATPSTTTQECPPGLEKKTFYRVSPVVNSFNNVDSNFNTSLTATIVRTVGSPPANFSITRYAGGTCNGTTCTLPSTFASTATQAYTSSGEQFCVIPGSLLP